MRSNKIKEVEEIVEDFLTEFTEEISYWWETGKDSIPKASDLVDKIKKFIN